MKCLSEIAAIVALLVFERTLAFPRQHRSSKLAGAARPTPTSPSSLPYAAISVDESAPRDMASFEEWASYNGIQRAEGVQLATSMVDDTGYIDVSTVANQPIPASSPAIYVPSESILSANAAIQELGGRLGEVEELICANGYGTELRQYYLMLKILVEVEKGRDSPWFAYLNALPRYFSNGAAMTPFCFSVVPPLVSRLCKDERARLKNLLLGRRGIPFLGEDAKTNEALWKWAYCVVYTRGFESDDGAGDYRIAPMADMINHSADPNAELVYDDYGGGYVRTTRDVRAGEALCMSFADPTNPSFLLSRYGFLDVSSPATFCKIFPPGGVTEELSNLGYSHGSMLFFKDTGDVSEPVWDVLLYLALGETDPNAQRQFYDAHMRSDFAAKSSMHEQCCEMTMAKLADHIDTFLADLDDLQRTGQYSGDPGEHPRLPLIMRHNEFVRNTFLAVKTRQGLGQLTSYA